MFCRKCGTENEEGVNYCKACGDVLINRVERKSMSLEIANPWKRLAAALIDGLILSAIFVPLRLATIALLVSSGNRVSFEHIDLKINFIQFIGSCKT